MNDPDDVTTQRFRHMSAVPVVASALLHATVAAALLPVSLPQEVGVTERTIEVTLELPSPPVEAPAPAAADQAALKSASGAAEPQQAAAKPGHEKAPSALTPVPADPDVALILPSAEPPPVVAARDFGRGASPPAPEPNLERILPPVDAPPLVTGRDFARTAPPARPTSSRMQQQAQATAPSQPIRQARHSRQASRQHAAQGSTGQAREAASPVTEAATDYSNHQAQQDYLWRIVRKLSQYRFYSDEESEQGLVVARLTIARDGRLLDVSVARSSGFLSFDRQVVETIRRASPFAPLPREIAADRYAFIVPVNYIRER